MKHYTHKQIEDARNILKSKEEKENRFKQLKQEVKEILAQYPDHTFSYGRSSVAFSVIKEGKLKQGLAICDSNDKFNKLLGEAIAIRKALGKRYSDIVELVESKNSGWYATAPSITLAPYSSGSYTVKISQ